MDSSKERTRTKAAQRYEPNLCIESRGMFPKVAFVQATFGIGSMQI